MKHSIPVLPFLRRSAVARLVPALALCALALPARADSPSLFGLTVNGDDIACASGEGWTFDGATVSLAGPGPFVLSTGSVSFTSNVAVVAQSDCAVTFSNLEVFAGNHAGLSPFTVSPGVSVALRLDGNTVLEAGAGAAAITVVSNETGVALLTIDADASDTFHTLGANGGGQGAGIGGGDGEACGSVTINGGVVSATGGANAAGIGGGRNGAGGTVTISGGRLNVESAGNYVFVNGKFTSVNGGAAIGGGYNGAGGMTAISGGTVSLNGVAGGAAVGPGKDGAGGTTVITGGSILALVGAVEPTPSNGVARVWPVAVSNLTAGAAAELPWLPATYGTNDLVATMGGEVCVWLPTGDYAYGEVESDGTGGWRRHAVLVDAEGNVTLDGWVVSPDPTSASAGLLYSNNFTTRTSSDATPSDRWMEAAYVPGALVRPVFSISSEGREPYNYATEYQDGWAMKTGYCRESVLFTVADDSGNQGALVNAKSGTTSYQSATIAMQPFYNEFTNGVLKISVDIRTPALSTSFNSSGTACATLAPFYKSALDVTSSTFAAPMHFGPANMQDTSKVWHLRAVTRGRAAADSPGAAYFGQNDSRNDITTGSWMRYEAVLDLDAGTYTATFANLGTAHPTPDTTGGSPVAFRQDGSAASSTTFAFHNPLTEETGGVAGLAFYVQGIRYASSAADAPMYDNIAVSWKAPGAEEFASVYENDFSARRYRQVEPAGTTSGTYSPAPTTNVVQSSFYDRWQGTSDYGVSDSSTSARRLVPDGAPYLGQDGWRRIAGEAYFKMVDPNKNDGYDWNNASVLRATGSGRTGMVAVPIGTTVSSGKVRLSCDILMGALTNSTSQTRDISAAAFLAGDGAFTNDCYDSTRIRVADVSEALRNKGVCGAGTCYSDRSAGAYQTNTRLYNFNGASYSSLKDTAGNNKFINCGWWARYVVTLDLDAGKFDVAIYNLGYEGQAMDYDHSSSTLELATNNLSLASSAIRNVDSVVLFSDGQDNYNGKTTSFNGKKLGRFPLFDNVRVCLVDDDGADGTELYACNFEYGYRMSVQNAAALVGPSDREGAGRWIRRGGNYGTISAVDAGDGDNVVVMDGLGWISGNTIATGYAVQPFGATTKDFDSVDFAADIRPPACFARSSDCFTYVEIGGDAYAQGVHRPASSSSWRNEPRIGFGFSVGAGYNDVKQYTNVVLTVQTVASKGASETSATSPYVIDKSHWYRFRVKANQQSEIFTVKVYDQGAAKPAASDADGALVATFADMDLPSFGDEGMTTFGFAGAGFASSFGGGIDDPYVALIDNLSASAVPASAEPTIITTREGLAAISDNLAGTYALGADIDLGGADWTPLGNDSTPFTGSFHGNGHTISGLVCTNNPSANSCRGLFGCASNATIKCVSVSGLAAGRQYVGGLVGRARGGTVISNCVAVVEVTATGSYAGGLVGSCDGGDAPNRIIDCRADGFVGGNGFVGGFIGYVYTPAMVSNCVARGDVRSASSDYGGFVGRFAHDSATIADCWSSGAVWGTGGNIGSFVGNRGSGTITNCAASAYANGLRLFCGSSTAITGDMLSLSDVHARSAGWPSAPRRAKSSAMIPISTADELRAVTNNLAGSYVLTADIDLDGEDWTPIGNQGAAFTGEFYGQNHKISGFSVNTMNRYAGLFGKIAGGRVSGVQAEGDVTGFYEGSGSDVGVGGFAGKIDSKSLVDGCSFVGWVMNTATYNAGGFVGYTADSPAILRCCVHVSVENGSGQPNTGGFIGNHGGGSIMDCYAEAEVKAGGSYVGGFAGFVATAARIATSWCSGQVDATDTYRGAFVGQANGSGLIMDSYYDTSANGQVEASGTSSPRGSAAYAGITPLDADDMMDKASFPVFDFAGTWVITEADGAPMLRTFFSAYDLWLKDAGIAYEPEPDELVNGIPAGARYVFGIDPQIGPENLAEPLIDIMFNTDGKPYVKLPTIVNTEGARVSVLATEDLADWSHPSVYQVDPATGICAHDFDPVPPKMFFKYSIWVYDN